MKEEKQRKKNTKHKKRIKRHIFIMPSLYFKNNNNNINMHEEKNLHTSFFIYSQLIISQAVFISLFYIKQLASFFIT